MPRTHLFTALFTLQMLCASHVFALTCSQIRDKADATYQRQKKKTACVLVEHVLGVSPGSTESVYSCAGKKYRLLQHSNSVCKVTSEK